MFPKSSTTVAISVTIIVMGTILWILFCIYKFTFQQYHLQRWNLNPEYIHSSRISYLLAKEVWQTLEMACSLLISAWCSSSYDNTNQPTGWNFYYLHWYPSSKTVTYLDEIFDDKAYAWVVLYIQYDRSTSISSWMTAVRLLQIFKESKKTASCLTMYTTFPVRSLLRNN